MKATPYISAAYAATSTPGALQLIIKGVMK